MNLREIFQKLGPEKIALAGLTTVFFLAGVSKFFQPGLWTGFEPSFISSLADSTTLVYIGGITETTIAAGLSWCRTRKYFSLVGFIWLFTITIQVINLGLWGIAIRDIGLLFLALTVILQNRGFR